MSTDESEKFLHVRELVLGEDFFRHGVGSLGEKAQHAILKNYYCPNTSSQEINLGRYVADIADESGVTEIQTRHFYSMKKKLSCFLESYPVRIIYPVPAVKWIVWVNPETGEISDRRRSPKKNALLGLFDELYGIRDLLWRENLSITAVLLESEEYRLLDGWGNGGKRGSNRSNMLPLRLIDEVKITSPADLMQLVPDGLPESFTSADLSRLTRLNARHTGYMISVLRHLGLIEQIGKDGRRYLYRICSSGT